MPSAAITTLGCKVNQYESAGIAEALSMKGLKIVPFHEKADIYIVNTCTVTGKTDYQSRQLIRRAHRLNPEASIIVTGCYAQVSPDKLAAIAGVTMVVGTKDKERIPSLIERINRDKQQVIVTDSSLADECSCLPAIKFQGRTRAFLKIQDGCNAFCSYCIIPYARGRSRSLPERNVAERVLKLTESGYREIVLTGIHIGNYGLDLSPKLNFLTLLQKIEKFDGAPDRLRISSIEPMELSDNLIEHISHSKMICNHLHIPLQNGDNTILRLMNRNYTREQYQERIERILDAVPDIAVGTDIMVGFPGEGEKEFKNTCEFIKEIPFAYLHVFPYSIRSGTSAAKSTLQVPEMVKKERVNIIRTIAFEKRLEFNEKYLGKHLSVLIEDSKDRKTGFFKGFSRNYVPILVTNCCDEPMTNHIIDVVADKTFEGKLLGRSLVHG